MCSMGSGKGCVGYGEWQGMCGVWGGGVARDEWGRGRGSGKGCVGEGEGEGEWQGMSGGGGVARDEWGRGSGKGCELCFLSLLCWMIG